jgi:phosphomannomutase
VTWVQVVVSLWICAVTFAAAGTCWMSAAHIADKLAREQFVSESINQTAERVMAGEVPGTDGVTVTYSKGSWVCRVRVESTDTLYHLVAEADGEAMDLWIPKS